MLDNIGRLAELSVVDMLKSTQQRARIPMPQTTLAAEPLNLDDVSDATHRRFWLSPARYEVLRNGFRALCGQLNRKPSWFVKSTKDVTGHSIEAHTLVRFSKNNNRTMAREHAKLTILLLTCQFLLGDPVSVGECADLQKLRDLSRDLSREVGLRLNVPPADEVFGTAIPRDTLVLMLQTIKVPPGNDPEVPEFPPFAPRFPATPVRKITIEGRPIFVKDESYNPTGSHKDRMAWEIVVKYKEIIEAALNTKAVAAALPQMSIISSGSAALAIQTQLRMRGLPNLKVLMDETRTDVRIVELLRGLGAEVFLYNLDGDLISRDKVLELTENDHGDDLTTRKIDQPFRDRYYDWLAYEILLEKPKHIFCPVGTGDLLSNIAFIIADELSGKDHDLRLVGGIASVKGISLYGARPRQAKTRMDKLYAKYNPSMTEAEDLIASLVSAKVLAKASGIFSVSEPRARQAAANLHREGICSEESGAAGLALCMDRLGSIPRNQKILVVNTGQLHLAKGY